MNEAEKPTTAAEPATIDFGRIYAAFLRRSWLAAGVFVMIVGGVALWTFRQTPIYRAEASIVIDLNPPQVLKNVPEVVDLGNGNYWSTKEYFETQYRILRSRTVAEKVVARLGLDHDDEFLHMPPGLDPVERARRLKVLDPVKMVADRIQVAPVKDSRVVVIAIEDPNPNRAAELANAVAEEYIEQNVDRKVDTTRSASEWLAGQLTTIKKQLEDSDKALYTFKSDHDVLSTSLEARQNISSEKLVAINDSLTKTELRRVELETRRQALEELLQQSKESEFKAESFRPVVDSPLINELKREYFRLQSEKAELMDRYLEGHPKRIAIDERIAKVKSDIAHATQTIIDASEGEYRQTIDEEKRLKNLLEQAKQEALAVNKLELDYDRLKREKDQNQQVYDLMMKRQKEVDVAGLLKTNNIRLLDAALVPAGPISPRPLFNLALAIVLGLVLGIGTTLLLELFDNTVKTQDDVERELGVAVLGLLPSIVAPGTGTQVVERDLFLSTNPTSAVSECARAIRTSLLFASPDRPFRVLLVASTGPREGKSTTAINLAVTMAQSGARVLLIDGDLRRPRLHRTFGVPSSAGLSTLILGNNSLDEAVKSTQIPSLFLLPAGPIPPNPAELLQSERYQHTIDELSSHYDRIIIDSPPIGVVTDALIMSAKADGVVLVLRCAATQKKVARRGIRALADVRAHLYGAVLNDVDLGSRAGRYYYYYRYGYGADYSSPKQPPAEASG